MGAEALIPDRRDRQIAAGWLLALVILACPSLIVVPPRFGQIPLAVSAAYVLIVALAILAAAGLVAGLRGRPRPRAPIMAAVAIVASIALATLAGVLTD